MAKHIHIWVGKTKDAGPAHAPAGSSKGGQFVSGSGGGGSATKKIPSPAPSSKADQAKVNAPKYTPMKQADPEVAFRREMIAKHPRGTTFFYNNETKTTEAYHKGKLVGSLKDHS